MDKLSLSLSTRAVSLLGSFERLTLRSGHPWGILWLAKGF